MMYPQTKQCPIWPKYPASVSRLDNKIGRQVDSQRAGGIYLVSEVAILLLKDPDPDNTVRARLTTGLINHRHRTSRMPEVNQDVIEDARSACPLQDDERAKRLLVYLQQYSSSPSQELALFGDHLAGALAWSESVRPEEMKRLCDRLIEEGWVRRTGQPTDPRFGVVVTNQGHRLSNEAFVTMWRENR